MGTHQTLPVHQTRPPYHSGPPDADCAHSTVWVYFCWCPGEAGRAWSGQTCGTLPPQSWGQRKSGHLAESQGRSPHWGPAEAASGIGHYIRRGGGGGEEGEGRRGRGGGGGEREGRDTHNVGRPS